MNKTQYIGVFHEKSKSGLTVETIKRLNSRPFIFPLKIFSIDASRDKKHQRNFYSTLSGKDFSLRKSKFICTSGNLFSNEKIKSSIQLPSTKKSHTMKLAEIHKPEQTKLLNIIYTKQPIKNSKELLLHKITPLPFLKIVPELRTRLQKKSKRAFSSELHRYKARISEQSVMSPILKYLLNIQGNTQTTKSIKRTDEISRYHSKYCKKKVNNRGLIEIESLDLNFSKLHFNLLKCHPKRLEVKSQLK